MNLIKSKQEVANITFAGRIVGQILATLSKLIIPGNNGLLLVNKTKAIMQANNCQPSFLNYQGFPSVICISINDQLIHGIPTDYCFQEGDLVSIDVGCQYQGYHADAALTKIVGQPHNKRDVDLLLNAQKSLNNVISCLKPGMRVGDVEWMIGNSAFSQGYYVPLNYTGHGIGKQLHEEPAIFNFGQRNTGMRLLPGMVICVEPMFLLNSNQTKVLTDGWTVVSADGANNCHFEHTILITETGCQFLTDYTAFEMVDID